MAFGTATISTPPRELVKNFVSAPHQARISAEPISDDSPHLRLGILHPPIGRYNYYTLNTPDRSNYFTRAKHFADKIKKDNLQGFLKSIEERQDKKLFKVGFEARFGTIYWKSKSSGGLPRESSPGDVQNLFERKWNDVRTDFIPEVQEGDLSRLLSGRERDKLGPEAIALTIKFFLYPKEFEEENERTLYSISISASTSAPSGFSIDAVYQEEYLDRVKVNFALPGRKYDMRISDSCKRTVLKEEASVPHEVASTIVNSLRQMPGDRLRLILHGTTKNLSYWNVKFIRQRKETKYTWKIKWILACYNVDIFDNEKENGEIVPQDEAFNIPKFDYSRKEVELWGKHIYPNKTQPQGGASPEVTLPESDWTAKSLMEDFDKFTEEAFQIAHILDGSQQS